SLLLAGALTTPQNAIAQQIVDVNPQPGSAQEPANVTISGVFDTSGTPAIDPASVKIFLNERDVTNQSTITRNFFSYRSNDSFPNGQNKIRVEFSNIDGLRQAASWNFDVQAPQTVLQISSVTHNANAPLTAGENVLITVKGTSEADAMVMLTAGGETLRDLRADEVSPGVYVTSFTVPADLVPTSDVIVTGQLTKAGGQVRASANQTLAFGEAATAGDGIATEIIPDNDQAANPVTEPILPLKPEFTNYQNGSQVSGEGFTLEGKTRPGARVAVVVTAPVASVGGFLNLGSETLLNREVIADAEGQFSVDVPRPTILSSGAPYNIRATATDGTERSVTEFTVRQR
ncbi:MAG: hypothetical protein AAGF24_09505, partial [Cyanobacteria bacterium P01_H01_bin.121]